MVSGMVMIRRYFLAAATAARPIPVLPEVGSIMVPPGCNLPDFSASSTMALAIRSFTEPAGLKYSSFAKTVAFRSFSFSNWVSSTSGVPPTRSRIDL